MSSSNKPQLWQRFTKWWRTVPTRLVRCLALALLGMAALTVVVGIVVLLTGGAGGLNWSLDGMDNIFGSPSYHPENNTRIMLGMFRNFYPGFIPFMIIMAIIVGVIVVVAVVSVLAWLGRQILHLVSNLTGRDTRQVAMMTVFVTWALTVLLIWMVLNITQTIIYLLASCGLMILNLLLMWLNLHWQTTVVYKEKLSNQASSSPRTNES